MEWVFKAKQVRWKERSTMWWVGGKLLKPVVRVLKSHTCCRVRRCLLLGFYEGTTCDVNMGHQGEGQHRQVV